MWLIPPVFSVYIVFCKLYIFFQAKEILLIKKKVVLILLPIDQKTKVGLWKRNMKKKFVFPYKMMPYLTYINCSFFNYRIGFLLTNHCLY